MIIPALPDTIELKIGASALRHEKDADFQAAMNHCAASISSSYALNMSQFEMPESIETFCSILERSIQGKYEHAVVLNWNLENGKTIFYVDVFYEAPNAPFSHKQGAVH